MSISTISSNITRTQKDIADLQLKISLESKKEAECSGKIGQIQASITKNTSASTLNSKLAEIARKQSDIAKAQSKKAEIQKKLTDKEGQLLKLKQDLSKEEERERKKQSQLAENERKKLEDLEKRRQREQLAYQKRLQEEIRNTNRLASEVENHAARMIIKDHTEYDLFISHATEDKEDFVRPLAETLKNMGVRVWYDEFTLKVGDSLRASLDHGLAKSRFGTVVLSATFCLKNWTQYELNSMVAREMNGHKMILPIWHKISKDEVLKFSPALADKIALNTSISSIQEIANELADVILDDKKA
jgi:hypothetical protein